MDAQRPQIKMGKKSHTRLGWWFLNGVEKLFGQGGAEQGEFENLKIKLTNFISMLIDKFKDSLTAEIEAKGKEIEESEKVSKATVKESMGGGVKEASEKVMSGTEQVANKAKDAIPGKGSMALIKDAGIDMAQSLTKGSKALIGKDADIKLPGGPER